jgi:DNA polymerase-3 subunit gamma/tau
MSYKALYLTYRPQTFEEVAGQKAIVRTLKNSLASGKIAHAYLFAGPRGTGKTTMARLLAKALNCEEGVGHQCNKCSNCLSVSEGSHPDVIEIDAASNNGVDQVRDLVEKVKYAPIKGRYKIYIIDEVHMMSTGAFNALLKTLEEPPENVIFILCTTEPYKVLPTILSRCQRFDFGKLSDEEMKGKLVEILNKEGSEYDDDGVNAVISLADGGMRDSLSILDQVLAYSGNKLHESDVLTIFGLASKEEKINLIKTIRMGDVASLMKTSENMLSAGIDIRRLVGDLIAILKDLLVYEKTGMPSLLENIHEEDAKSLSKEVAPSLANKMIGVLISAQNDFKNVNDVRSLFELTLLRLASEQSEVGEEKARKAPLEEPKPVIKETPAPVVEKAAPVEEKKEEPLIAPAPKVDAAPIEQPAGSAIPDFLLEQDDSKIEVAEKIEKKEEPAKPTYINKPIERKTTSIKIVKPDEPLDTSNILKPEIALDGDAYEMPDEEIMKIIVSANKPERTALVKKWHRLDALRGHPQLGNLATLLSEGHPFCLCHEVIVLTYDFSKLKKKCNIKANQKPLSELLSKLLDDGREVFVYGIDPNDRNRLITMFNNLNQVGKLPKKSEAQDINLPK